MAEGRKAGREGEHVGVLPRLPQLPPGWFYARGQGLYAWLSISARNIPDDQRKVADFLAENYRKNKDNPDWQWRTPFRTKKYDLGQVLSQEDVSRILDRCLTEIEAFEKDVATKWQHVGGSTGHD